jgi:hypothetical protein
VADEAAAREAAERLALDRDQADADGLAQALAAADARCAALEQRLRVQQPLRTPDDARAGGGGGSSSSPGPPAMAGPGQRSWLPFSCCPSVLACSLLLIWLGLSRSSLQSS